MHLKYKHDGSEGPEDHFTLRISDGVNYNEKVVNVKVMPLKDEQPQVTKNAGLKVLYCCNEVIYGYLGIHIKCEI